LSPRSFPPKKGELKGARSAHITFRGQTWCVVYDVDDDYFEVMVLAIGPHDVAYRKAARRRR
jgi:mRNA-degrading endonuclease YafQ of YafQ-DinJ toxin-antitoxin module